MQISQDCLVNDMELKYSKIGDLCNVSSSRRVFAKQYVEEGIPFYRQKEIIDKKNGNALDEPIFISEAVYNELKEKSGAPISGDLLITAVGATLGIPYVVGDEKFYFKDGNLIWLSNFRNELNSEFLYYWIDSSFGTQTLWNRTIGSAQPALTIDSIKKLSIPIPSRHIQDKIATSLKTYDALIDNNNKRIKVLERMAENLYKEWFVRFRFPGYESAEFENGIPKGWEIRCLADYGRVETGKTPSTEFEDNYGDEIMFIKTPDMHGNLYTIISGEYLSKKGHATQPKKLLPPNSIMVSCIGTAGVVSINAEQAHTNQQINSIIVDNPVCLEWLYFTCKSLKGTIEMFGATGATMTNLSKGKFEKLKVVEPTEELLLLFHQKASLIFEQIKILMHSNQNLTKQRDILLPRLMSGKLEV